VTAATSVLPAPRVDWGRLFLVPVFALLLAVNVTALAGVARGRQGAPAAMALLTSALTAAFYLLLISAYLRRGRPAASSASMPARLAAVAATWLPMLVPFVGGYGDGSVGRDTVAGVLILAGLAWSVWSVKALGSNLSVIAQVRGLASTGPYRWVRHPLYAGEIVTMLGTAIRSPHLGVVGLWVLLVLLQAYRAVVEEQLLTHAKPGYADYCCATARFVPGLF